MRRRATLLALAIAGCGSRDPVVPDGGAPPPATVAPSAAPARTATAPAASATSPLPRAFLSLGQPCRADATPSELCGADGRVAGLVAPVDHVLAIPPDVADKLFDTRSEQGGADRELTIAVEGDRLWIRAVTCGRCRRIMGWGFVGELSRLSDAQLVSVQKRVGLPDDVGALRTAGAWKRAIASAPRLD